MSLKFRNPNLIVNVTRHDWEEAVRLLKSGKGARVLCCPNALACTRALRAKFRRHPEVVGAIGSQLDVMEDGERFIQADLPDFARKVVSVFDGRVTADPATTAVYVPVVGTYKIDLSKATS